MNLGGYQPRDVHAAFYPSHSGRLIRVNLARPQKGVLAQTPAFGRASE